MDNENKEIDLETPEIEPGSLEIEFDPTESEEFYNNLEAAIGFGEDLDETDIPELLAEEDLLETVADSKEQDRGYSPEQEEDLFVGVDAALAEQIEKEFGREETSSTKEVKSNKFTAAWKGIPTWTKVLVSVILVVLLSVGLLFGTPGGRNLIYKVALNIAFQWVEVVPEEPTEAITPPTGVAIATITPEATPGEELVQIPTVVPPPEIVQADDEIINILLLGEEKIHGETNGRTDAIILVSVNLNGGPIKMVSFLRDLYVEIPKASGSVDGKINRAFSTGGADLTIATIEKNFGVDIDSYVKVDFDGFEEIIDKLGGLRISLSAKESEYLNTTKYISNPAERNTVAGYQNMTGSQVLGYCRVRLVEAIDDSGTVLYMDTGRNYRHRVVLKAIFNKYKEKSLAELIQLVPMCLSYVSAPADLKELALECLPAVIEKKMFSIETLQFPRKDLLSEATINGESVICYFPENLDILHEFLYGEE